jgi:2-keto-4-pentenoate hydratase/2-oxohepta-3-ene-1,7-dioic acid hydratase in catechol pathway
VRLLAPIDPPSIRDFSVFEQHIEGIVKGFGPDAKVPETWYRSPFCYFSNPGAVTGPGDEIPIPPGCRDLDLELEVAVIIGGAGRNLTPEQAGGYIAGYTIFNDWSARDLQTEEMKLGLGICKGKDFANTLGPWVVTPDELEPFRSGDRLDLDLRARVNDRELGDDTLANMAWSFEELISYASRGTWIRPGDVLGSGTCGSGCLLELRGRHGRDAYPALQAGDTVTLSVEGIGTLTNRVVPGVEPVPLPEARPGRLRSRAPA